MAQGVSFAGDGKKDVSDKMPGYMGDMGMSSGGPVMGPPETNKGATAPETLKQTEEMPQGNANIKFAGDIGK